MKLFDGLFENKSDAFTIVRPITEVQERLTTLSATN